MAIAGDEAVLERLEELTRNAYRFQQETLRSILSRNAGAGYLRRYLSGAGADSIPDSDSFRRLVPVSTYHDYAEIIDRIADGTEPASALSSEPLVCFFLSSGTSSLKPKLVPFFESTQARSASSLSQQASSALIRRFFPPRPYVNKLLWFLYCGDVRETKSGYKAMAATSFPFHIKGSNPSPIFNLSISPPAVILGTDTYQQMYCHLLCGLRCTESIDAIRAPYAAGLVRAIRFLQSKWTQLCNDIDSGSINTEITDITMRDSVSNLLGRPKPVLAAKIRQVCEQENWGGILCKLWPEARYISCVMTGSMQQYYHIIKYFAGETLPLLGGDYFSSECPIGINLDRVNPPCTTSYIILPTVAYFEFLPFHMGDDSNYNENEIVDISKVELEKIYEMVVTTNRGFYRYRLGDVVKIIGFHNLSPKLEFVTRAPIVVSEILNERDLMCAMERFQLLLQEVSTGEVVEFAGFLDQKQATLFVEVSKDCVFMQVERKGESRVYLSKWCSAIEDCFGSVYRVKRASGEIGPLEISVVGPGSFDRLAELAVQRGAPAHQYKPPKIVRNVALVEILKESVVLKSLK